MAAQDPHIEEINLGEPTEPRPAAAVILVRDGSDNGQKRLELLLAQRTHEARFMAGVWVFPGGAVDGDISDEAAHRATAVRELREEVGVEIDDVSSLVPFSRWITPTVVKVRFDTRFYLAQAARDCRPEPDREEIVDTVWLSPTEALARNEAGELLLVFPTIKQLESLSELETVEQALADARSHEVEPILPRIVGDSAENVQILLPGDPGY